MMVRIRLFHYFWFLYGNVSHYSVYFLKNPHILTKMCPSVYGTGKRALSDAWALDTAQKPYVWQRLNPDGDRPSARMLVIKLILMAIVERLILQLNFHILIFCA